MPDETRSGRFVGGLETTHIDKFGSRHVESEVKQETVLPVAGVFSAGEVVEVFLTMLQLAVIAAVVMMRWCCQKTLIEV